MSGQHEDKFNKWIFRQNARRNLEFGVEQPIEYGPVNERAGQSNRRHYIQHNPDVAKRMARENIEVLKAMRSEKYQETLKQLRDQAVEFYSKVRASK